MGSYLTLYITGANGLIGTRLIERTDRSNIKCISYRDTVPNLFDSHDQACLLHMGWSSNTRTKDETILERDVKNSEILFNKFLDKNPKGKIIFTSTAGDMYANKKENVCTELDYPNPRTRYSQCKLQVENILKNLDCKSFVLRISNIWGGHPDTNRQNGLVDKLLRVLNTDEEVKLFTNLNSHIDLIHVDDLISLIFKIVDCNLEGHELFLVGGQSVSIWSIINIISKKGYLNLKIDQTDKSKFFISIDATKSKSTFDWKPENYLK